MKKTLIALAAIAAMSTSFAQVSITGKLGFSVQADEKAGAAKTKGLQMSDGDINFAASEDLGGGLKASVASAMKLRGRDVIGGRNGTITLSNSNMAFTVGAVESGTTLTNAWVSAPASFAMGPDSNVLDGYANVDLMSLTIPMGNVSVGAGYVDIAGAGMGALSGTQLFASYNASGLSLTGDVTNYTSAAAQVDGLVRTRLTASYDMGVVAFGVGFQSKNKGIASQTAFGISAPVGALTLGLTYSVRSAQAISADAAITTAAAEMTGTTLGATYAMSKTTSLYAGYATYTGITGSDNEYRVRLLKSF